MRTKLVVVNSAFSLVYSYCIFGDTAVYIVSDGISISLIKEFKKQGICIIFIPRPKSSILLILYYMLSNLFVIPFLKYKYMEFAGHDHFFLSNLLCKPYILIEDGLGNYISSGVSRGVIYKVLYKKWLGLGRSSFCKSIYLTNRWEIPEELLGKVKVYELNVLFKKNFNSLNKLFNFSLFSKQNGKIGLIIYTQPLYIDNYCSLEEQYLIYKKILYKYSHLVGNRNEIVLKPHPRDTLDYSCLNLTIIDRNIPAELLNYILPSNIKKISLFSSSGMREKNHYFVAKEFLTDEQMLSMGILNLR